MSAFDTEERKNGLTALSIGTSRFGLGWRAMTSA